uniref:Enhancer of mRNA-decapping protein 4 WD40 repeat region domain-containing protein n=1 Tax=Ditylenchus dipsaci TaxID=166011 RepID=A0A915ERZ1_9BILA
MELLSPSTYVEKHTLNESEDFVPDGNPLGNKLRERDSARANSTVLTDYKWETKAAYTGRILAAREKLVAYRLFNTTGEAIRVLERDTRARHLIKDFRQPTVDLQWATHSPFLAVLDADANVYVYQVDEKCKTLVKYLNIIRTEKGERTECNMLAVAQGSKIDIFFLHTIKSALNKSEVHYEQLVADEVPGGMLSVTLTSEVTSIKLSPDATAMAVSTVDKNVTFFVVETDKTRFANTVQPMPNHFVEELIFLDNLAVQNQEQFWKFAVVSSDSGRRLAIFDCDSWQCLGKLRFESPQQINHLELLVDSTANFLFVVDYDASSLYCLELANVTTMPCFASCTQVNFCNPLLSVVPCGLVENLDCDLSLDEDDSSPSSITATFVAITHRSLLELSIDLERCQIDPTAWLNTPRSQLDVDEQHMEEALQINTNLAADVELVVIGDEAPEIVKNSEKTVYPHSNAHLNSGTSDNTSILEEFSNKIINLIDEKMHNMSVKIGQLSIEVEKLQQENRDLRNEQTDNLSNVLEKISNEIKMRDERIETTISELNSRSQEHLLRAMETVLNANALNVQSIGEGLQSSTVDTVRSTVNQMLLPAVEGVCQQLFQQLNETFKDGLQEFVEQMRKVQEQQIQQASQTPTPLFQLDHNSAIIQLIESGQIIPAFELALSFKELASVVFVCNKVDPDTLFSTKTTLPINLLSALLQQLSLKLDTDTHLKFRYIENILMYLDGNNSGQPGEKIRNMLEQLNEALTAFLSSENSSSSSYKREVKIINSLANNLLKYKYKG